MARRDYLRNLNSPQHTPHSEPLPGREDEMVLNSTGGFVFPVTDWVRLERFLVLGAAGGSFYASERKLARENADVVERCLKANGERTVNTIVAISQSGRAPSNDEALFALAVAISKGDVTTRRYAAAVLPQVARTGTHLFHFVDYAQSMRDWGRILKWAVRNWYDSQDVDKVAFQAVKYVARDGWSHRDLLNQSSPVVEGDVLRNSLYDYIARKDGDGLDGRRKYPQWVYLAEEAKTAGEKRLVEMIHEHRLPMEVIPSEKRTNAVYAAMIGAGGMTWLVRNLGTLTARGILKPLSPELTQVSERLTNQVALQKARVHPISILKALQVYQNGHGERGRQTWMPVSEVTDALDEAFHRAFGAVEPAGKRFLLALDVSGSMKYNHVAGMAGMECRAASAAMALVTHRTEPTTHVMGFSHDFVAINIGARDRLDTVIGKITGLPFADTRIATPMEWALREKIGVDVFVIYTDGEINAGPHPSAALQAYRDQMGIPAKLVVVDFYSNGHSIADPKDAGSMNVIGFDTTAPMVISDFAKQGFGAE